jgi:hypothetical protein
MKCSLSAVVLAAAQALAITKFVTPLLLLNRRCLGRIAARLSKLLERYSSAAIAAADVLASTAAAVLCNADATATECSLAKPV